MCLTDDVHTHIYIYPMCGNTVLSPSVFGAMHVDPVEFEEVLEDGVHASTMVHRRAPERVSWIGAHSVLASVCNALVQTMSSRLQTGRPRHRMS